MIYFVYGSLMCPDEMRGDCPTAEALGPACLADHALAFPRWSVKYDCAVASLVAAPGETAWGALYRVDGAGERNMFRREGYDPDRAESENRYVLRTFDVRRGGPSGETVTARAFIANPDGRAGPPSAHYLGLILAGARHHGLPADYVAALARLATA